MIKSPALPPDLEVFNGKGVSTLDDLIVFVKRVAANLVARFVYDWLKQLFKGGD